MYIYIFIYNKSHRCYRNVEKMITAILPVRMYVCIFRIRNTQYGDHDKDEMRVINRYKLYGLLEEKEESLYVV